MDDLISRWAAIDALTDANLKRNADSLCDGDLNRARRAAQRVIAQLSAVDAVPVIHGHWTRIHIKGKEYGKVYYQHENCAPLLFESPYHYCPECGAKMDEQGKDVYINE